MKKAGCAFIENIQHILLYLFLNPNLMPEGQTETFKSLSMAKPFRESLLGPFQNPNLSSSHPYAQSWKSKGLKK